MERHKLRILISGLASYCLLELALPMSPWLIEYVLKTAWPVLGTAHVFSNGLAFSAILVPVVSLIRTDMAIRTRGLRRSESLATIRLLQGLLISFAIILYTMLLLIGSPVWPRSSQKLDSLSCYRFLFVGLFVAVTSGTAGQFLLATSSVERKVGTNQEVAVQPDMQPGSSANTGEGYPSCFISYSHKDENFARKLYADLQRNRVTCWYAPEDMKIGAKLERGIDEAIRRRDHLLIILSESSLASAWVESEVETALDEEKTRKRTVLFPVRIDNSVMESEVSWAKKLRGQRHIGDFTDWHDDLLYEKALKRLLRDLQPEDAV